jgi:predicted permease
MAATTQRAGVMRLGNALYRFLLRAFPPHIRDAHGEDMVRTFALHRRHTRGRVALVLLWVSASVDAIRHGLGARLRRTEVTAHHRQLPGTATRASVWFLLEVLWRDVRFAIRGLSRTPTVTAVAIIALALGIGANATIFTVVHAVLLAPLPYPDADRVVLLWRRSDSVQGFQVSPRLETVDRWRWARSFESIVAYASAELILSSGEGDAERIAGARVEPGLLAFTGAELRVGRPFTKADTASNADALVALLSDELWSRRFGRDPGIVGRTIQLDDQSVQVVGVLSRAFRMPLGRADVLLPLVPARGPAGELVQSVSVLGRLTAGVTAEAAAAELTALMHATGRDRWTASLMSPAELAGRPLQRALVMLTAGVSCVLLIACANVAHLLLARHAARRRELAVRAALGATRIRLVALLLTENLVLALAGGLSGGALTWVLLHLLLTFRPDQMPQLEHVRLQAVTWLFILLVSLIAGVAVGLASAWSAARAGVHAAGGERSIGDRGRRWVGQALSAAELALALVLLMGAGLLLRSYERLIESDRGFATGGLVSATVDLPASRYPDAAAQQTFFDRLTSAAAALPGVRRVVLASNLPPDGALYFGSIEVGGLPSIDAPMHYDGAAVRPGFFEALRIPIIEGRGFTESDIDSDAQVLVIGELAARRFFRGRSAVGGRLRLGAKSPWSTVIGVARDIKATASGPESIQIYMPLTELSSYQALLVESSDDTDRVVAALRAQLRAIDPKLPLGKVESLRDSVWRVSAQSRFNALLVGLLAAIGLVLATSGVYGVINYSVGLRVREFGLRIALGATPRTLGWEVLRDAGLVATFGTLLGLTIWLIVSRAMTSLLFELSPNDLWTLLAVAGILAIATLLASWAPARRAIKADPVAALREG